MARKMKQWKRFASKLLFSFSFSPVFTSHYVEHMAVSCAYEQFNGTSSVFFVCISWNWILLCYLLFCILHTCIENLLHRFTFNEEVYRMWRTYFNHNCATVKSPLLLSSHAIACRSLPSSLISLPFPPVFSLYLPHLSCEPLIARSTSSSHQSVQL